NESEDKYDRRPMARPALRRANVSKATRLYADCRADAGVGHRRQHGDFQRGGCVAVASVALPRIRAAGAVVRKNTPGRAGEYVVSELQRLAGTGPGVRGNGLPSPPIPPSYRRLKPTAIPRGAGQLEI